MLKVRRPKLNPDLQKDLAKRQRDVDEKRAGKAPWEEFQTAEQKRRDQKLPTVGGALENERTGLIDARRKTLNYFVTFEDFLDKLGPDFRAPDAPSIREHLLELLAPTYPHLAPIRQILRRDPERRKKLLERIPELGPLLDKWDAPPDDGTALRQSPKPPPTRGR